jgi:hypothetical protein
MQSSGKWLRHGREDSAENSNSRSLAGPLLMTKEKAPYRWQAAGKSKKGPVPPAEAGPE